MMTHTWLLKKYLREEFLIKENLDFFIYNICPDLLPIHKGITAEDTHGISRIYPLPSSYRKNAFVHFHLMVDDISHHGMITKQPIKEFNPDSQGYTYLKGKPLVKMLSDIYKRQGTPIPYAQAAYRSHMIIEMTFDLAMYQSDYEEGEKLIDLLCDAMKYTIEEKLAEFSNNIAWLYGIPSHSVVEAMEEGAAFYNRKRIRRFMTLEGRIHLFAGKFGISCDDKDLFSMLSEIMNKGMELVQDYGDFVEPTLSDIMRVGFNPEY